MQVFKGFFKIVKKNLGVILTYIFVFAGLMLIFGAALKNDSYTPYTIQKVNAYIVCEDTEEETGQMLAYLKEFIEEKEIGKQTVEDALFWDEIDIYIEIPADFFRDFLSGKENLITIKTTPDDMNAYALQTRITALLNQIRVLHDFGLAEDSKLVEEAVAIERTSEKSVLAELPTASDNSVTVSLFGYGIYVLSAVILTLTATIMAAFKSLEIKRRMNISAVSTAKLNFSLISGNICIAVLFACIIFFMSYACIGASALSGNAWLYLINHILFSLSIGCIAYALALFITSPVALQVVNVVFPLGASFLSGIFVPQNLLSKGVLTVAHLLPQYYAICCNSYIASENVSLAKYFSYIYPQFIFMAISIVLILWFYRKSSKKEA